MSTINKSAAQLNATILSNKRVGAADRDAAAVAMTERWQRGPRLAATALAR